MNIIPVECAKCGTKLKVKTGFGKIPSEIKCTKCGETIVVPREPAPAAESAAAAPAAAPPSEAAAVPELSGTTAAPAAPSFSEGGISFGCPGCKRAITVKLELAGKKLKCKQCGRIIPIPTPPKSQATAAMASSGPPSPAAIEPVAVLPAAEIDASPSAPVSAPFPAVVAAPPPSSPAPARPVVSESIPAPRPPPPPLVVTPSAAAAARAAEAAGARIATLESQIADLQGKLHVKESQQAAAEQRIVNLEKTLHEISSQKALELSAVNRRVHELEGQVGTLRGGRAEIVSECRADLDAAEQRMAVLKSRLARWVE